DARRGTDRRQRLHGRGRGADGGDGLQRQGTVVRTVAPRLPHPHQPRHAGSGLVHRREQRPRRPLRREGGRGGPAASGDSGHRQRHPRRLRDPHPRAALLSAAHPQAAPRARPPRRGAGRLMMPLPDLTVLRPDSVAEAVEALRANPGARLLAGGTDIVPNLKYGMYDTRHLVALRGLSRELRYVREEGGEVRLGALCNIDELAHSEVLKARLPALAKLRTRAAIDFPALNLAVAVELDGKTARSVALAVGALAARPVLIKGLEDLHGRPADARFAEELGRRAHKQCKPLTNIGVDPDWRREILPVLVRRATLRALG